MIQNFSDMSHTNSLNASNEGLETRSDSYREEAGVVDREVRVVDMSRAEMDQIMINRFGPMAANDNYFNIVTNVKVSNLIQGIFDKAIASEYNAMGENLAA